jgi:hypothetical protein
MRSPTISLVLAALLFRAYIPIGFMPGSGNPFLLQICPAGFQTPMPAQHGHHHMGSHTHVEACPFACAPAAGPVSHLIAFEPAAPGASQPTIAFELSRLIARLERAHQPRGPPRLA